MSSVLNGLIETYVIRQTEIIEHRSSQFDRLDAAIKAMQKQRDYRQPRIEPDFDNEPISPIYHDGSDFYDQNF